VAGISISGSIRWARLASAIRLGRGLDRVLAKAFVRVKWFFPLSGTYLVPELFVGGWFKPKVVGLTLRAVFAQRSTLLSKD
jgi:hypothetical protein